MKNTMKQVWLFPYVVFPWSQVGWQGCVGHKPIGRSWVVKKKKKKSGGRVDLNVLGRYFVVMTAPMVGDQLCTLIVFMSFHSGRVTFRAHILYCRPSLSTASTGIWIFIKPTVISA